MKIDALHQFIDVIASAAALVGLSIAVWSSRSAGKPPATGRARMDGHAKRPIR